MLEVDASVIGGWLGSVMWPFFRIGTFLLVAPVVGTQLVPARIRIILALMLTYMVAPHLPAMPVVDALSIESMIIVVQQVLIGVALGMGLQVLLHIFVLGGQMIAMKMGLGFASMVDPGNGVSVTVVSQFHLMMATLLFVTMNGHLSMIEIMVESFHSLPVGGGFIANNMLWSLAGMGSWMFMAALLMALPAVTALLIINCSLGVVTRAAPQLNIFAVGFPMMLVLGLCILWVTMGGYLPHFDRFTREALDMMVLLTQS